MSDILHHQRLVPRQGEKRQRYTVFVGNLPYDADKQEIHDHFDRFLHGQVLQVGSNCKPSLPVRHDLKVRHRILRVRPRASRACVLLLLLPRCAS